MTDFPPDRALDPMERSLQIVIDDVRGKKGSALLTVTQMYDSVFAKSASAFMSDMVDPQLVCHQLAGLSAANLLAAQKIVQLQDEIKAIKDALNLP